MKNRWTLQTAADLMVAQSKSGQSKLDFCAKQQINLATFYYWKKRLREQETPITTGFTQVEVSPIRKIEVQLSSGQWLAIRSVDADLLAEVLIKIGAADA
jgi:hypothetical protein